MTFYLTLLAGIIIGLALAGWILFAVAVKRKMKEVLLDPPILSKIPRIRDLQIKEFENYLRRLQ